MSNLRFINGKFYRGAVEVPPEIGNREQIALLKQFELRSKHIEEEAKKGSYEVEITAEDIEYTARLCFTCICGSEICEDKSYRTAWDISDLEEPDDFDNTEVECSHCGRRYRITEEHTAKLL